MPQEIPLQFELFSGELVDNRTPKQKKKAHQQKQPQQIEIFSQRELAQFGVRANPKIPLSPKTRLELAMEDGRDPETIMQLRQETIASLTYHFPWVHRGQDIDSSPEHKNESN